MIKNKIIIASIIFVILLIISFIIFYFYVFNLKPEVININENQINNSIVDSEQTEQQIKVRNVIIVVLNKDQIIEQPAVEETVQEETVIVEPDIEEEQAPVIAQETTPKVNTTKTETNNEEDIPYYIKVNYTANVVTIYTKDSAGEYTVPYKAMVCSCRHCNSSVTEYIKWTINIDGFL